MTVPGDVVLIEMRSAGSRLQKLRPVLVISGLPGPWQEWLVAGISTGTRDLVPDWDELVDPTDPQFRATGLKERSFVRLSYLQGVVEEDIQARIGRVPGSYVEGLGGRLAAHLAPSS